MFYPALLFVFVLFVCLLATSHHKNYCWSDHRRRKQRRMAAVSAAVSAVKRPDIPEVFF